MTILEGGYAMERRTIPLGFTSEPITEGMHICYLYTDEAERDRVMGDFLASGLLAHEKVICSVEHEASDPMVRRLRAMNVPEGALNVVSCEAAYYPGGRFKPQETLDLIQAFYRQAVDTEGFSGARGTGPMTWSLDGDRTDLATVIEYEARVNDLCDEHPYTACCQYDARKLTGHMIMDILSVHPAVIVHGQLVKNPYYIAPDAFLKDFQGRTQPGGMVRPEQV
jgi:hypothetical protein